MEGWQGQSVNETGFCHQENQSTNMPGSIARVAAMAVGKFDAAQICNLSLHCILRATLGYRFRARRQSRLDFLAMNA